MQRTKHVSYLRVSTAEQSDKGLSIPAQRYAVQKFLGGKDPDYEFVETESGRNNARPELARALACCKAIGARLVVAKLDRLSRNAHFLLGLMESKVPFVCVDMPNIDTFTLQILACVAQKEAALISQRTKDGLAAARRRGTVLGNPNIVKLQRKARAAKRKKARAFADKLAPVIAKARRKGRTTLTDLAEYLNARSHRTPTGKQFAHQSVSNLLALIDA